MSDRRGTILIVDDDKEFIDVLKDYFKERSCEVIATTDPVTVLHKIQNFSISLMLLDLKMRRLDGFGVLEKIKQAQVKLPPTLIVTGYLPKYEDRLKAFGIELNDVIQKPFDFEVIEERINQKLGNKIALLEPESEAEKKLYSQNRCRLGVIEDEEDILELFSEFFEEKNYSVSCFKNGKDALEHLRKEPVHILLVDIKLPGMQGDRVIEYLSHTSNPPYMIPMSADPLPEEMENRVRTLGCRDFFSKPFNVADLIEKVKSIAVEKGLLG